LNSLYRSKNLTHFRRALWTNLHKEPYIILQEDFLTNVAVEDQENSHNWLGGTYTFTYPTPHMYNALICVNIDWNAFIDPHKPSFRWSIDTPESLYHPGKHRGQLYVKKIEKSIFESKFGVRWESPIFSPFINLWGSLSSEGPLEERPAYLGFTDVMMSLAHFVAFGPYDERGDCPKAPYSFHSMDSEASGYFKRAERDAFARASSFFARAYTLEVPEEDQFVGKGFSNECRETSVVVIQELLQFYRPESLNDPSTNDEWDFRQAFANVTSHRDWAIEESKWATKLVDTCGFEFLRNSIKAVVESDDDNISARAASVVAAKSQHTMAESAPGVLSAPKLVPEKVIPEVQPGSVFVVPKNAPEVPTEVQPVSVPVVPLEKVREPPPVIAPPAQSSQTETTTALDGYRSIGTSAKEDEPPA
jgi:hypothetical protein